MSGVVAAGNPLTAEAAALILRAGGNAVDAATAGAAACFAAEPLLASAGGAGIMLVREPGRAPVAIDFFSAVPGLGAGTVDPAGLDFEAIEVDFGSAVQTFHVGRGAAAAPTMFEGLATAARRFGSLPLTTLMAPAVGLARDGIVLDLLTARTFSLLWEILRRDPACLEEIAHGLPTHRPPRVGERLYNPNLADTLESFAVLGGPPPALLDGLSAEFGLGQGGLIQPADLDPKVQICAPHRFRLGAWEVSTSPRLGGRLVGVIARALEVHSGTPSRESSEAGLVRAQALASRGGHLARVELPPAGHRGSTTQVSVVDGAGGAASVTLTSGEGCGHVVSGTGVHINNFLGEEDLNPAGFHGHLAGAALPTMIAPTIAVHDSGRVVALGSGGSNRIRSVVALVIHAIAVEGRGIEAAVEAPRVHGEDRSVWVELADRVAPHAIDRFLRGTFTQVHGFADRDFFFGGVHVAERGSDGRLAGIGDARRGGAAIVIA